MKLKKQLISASLASFLIQRAEIRSVDAEWMLMYWQIGFTHPNTN